MKLFYIFMIMSFVISACATSSQPIVETVNISSTPESTQTESISTSAPTATAQPTFTPEPTAIPYADLNLEQNGKLQMPVLLLSITTMVM